MDEQSILSIPDTRRMTLAEAARAWANRRVRMAYFKSDGSLLKRWRYTDRTKSTLLAPPNADEAARPIDTGVTNCVAIEPPPNLVILDIDHRPHRGWNAATIGAEIVDHFGLMRAPVSQTPSGGFHLWYSLPKGFRAQNWTSENGRLGFPGVDVRTYGGLVTIPPSTRHKIKGKQPGKYTWLRHFPYAPMASEELLSALEPNDRESYVVGESANFEGIISGYCERALENELSAVAYCGAGGRNSQLFKSSAALGSIVAAGGLPEGPTRAALYNMAKQNGLVKDDGANAVQSTIQSGFVAGMKSPRQIPASWGRAS